MRKSFLSAVVSCVFSFVVPLPKKAGRRSQNSKNVRPQVEVLETRNLLAGGITSPLFQIPEPSVLIVNEKVPKLDILPGAQAQVLAQMAVSTTGLRDFAQLGEMMFVPAPGCQNLGDANDFELQVYSNKVWSNIAYAQAGQNNVVDFIPWQAPWNSPGQTLEMRVVADVSDYPYTKNLGVDLAFAGFYDLRGNQVPNANVTYAGVSPVLQTVENEYFDIYQQQMPNVTATVLADSTGVPLYQFIPAFNNATPGSVTFVAAQGSLANANNYLLTQTDFNGVFHSTVGGTIVGNTLVFNFDTRSLSGGIFTVYATTANTTVAGNPYLQLAPSSTSPLTGTNTNTNKPLQGLIENGVGAGELQVWAYPNYATTYKIVPPPLVVSQNTAYVSQTLPPNSTDEIGSFVLQNTSSQSVNVNSLVVNLTGTENASNLSGYTHQSLLVRVRSRFSPSF